MGRQFSTLALGLPSTGVVVGALVGLILIVDAPSAYAQTSLPIAQPRYGTTLVRSQPLRMFIPAEKSYGELTPDQKAKFRAQFSNLADADDPSYPVAGLRPVAEEIVQELANGPVAKGALFLTVHVDEQGEPKSTAVYETPDSRVSRVAAAVLMKAKYKPAQCKGKPCSSEFPFTARFDVQ